MFEKLNQATLGRQIAFALILLSVSTPQLTAEPLLKSQTSLSAAAKTGLAASGLPPAQTPAQANNLDEVTDWQADPAFRCLDQIDLPSWLAKPSLFRKAEFGRKQIGNEPAEPSQAAGPPEAGNGDLTLEFGLSAYGQRLFSQQERQIIISIYRFATTEGAYGAYCCLRKGASNLIAKGDASSEDDRNICFWKDKYFINVTATSAEDSESKALATKIAAQLALAIPTSSVKPRILAQLPTLERVLGSEKIVMGPLSLKKLFPAPNIALLAGETLHGAIADYQVQEPYRERLKLLVLQFANPTVAALSFTKYLAQLEEQHDQQDVEGVSYQTSIFKIGNYYLLCQKRSAEVVIITGARKRLSLTALANEVY